MRDIPGDILKSCKERKKRHLMKTRSHFNYRPVNDITHDAMLLRRDELTCKALENCVTLAWCGIDNAVSVDIGP